MVEVLEQLASLADECVQLSAWQLSDMELRDGADTLHQAATKLQTALAHLVKEIDGRGLPAADGTRSTVTWLHERWRITPAAAGRLVGLARTLDQLPLVDQALGSGEITVEHAGVIGQAVKDLPGVVGPAEVGKAEGLLVDLARDHAPHVVARCGERILHHIAPQLADRADAEALARMERKAEQRRTFTLTDLHDGGWRLSGYLTNEAAATVHAAIDPLSKPVGAAGTDQRSPGMRRADALAEACRMVLNAGDLPENGGDRPQVVVTVDYDILTKELSAGQLDSGDRLTPETVRRMSCDAKIIPAMMDSAGCPLDVGRANRAFDGTLRRALVLRDGGCAFPDCNRHPRWCQGHHVTHWSHGGETSLTNGTLLCGRHHWMIHHTGWEVHIAADGKPEFLPPSHVDPQRRPRRNPYRQRQRN